MLKFYLVIEKGLAGKRVFLLQPRHTNGRAPESNIHLPDSSVSRKPVLIFLKEEKSIAEEAGSTNGTYVNEEPV
jgi:pSer/pThr/pTyr-binding forkhead associated (FHA) protein